MPRREWLLLLAAGLSGCVKYRPQPIDPPRLERDYRERTLSLAGPLDLHSLTKAALELNPSLAVARARIRSAEAGIVTAKGRPNPSLSVGGGYTNSPESALVFHFDPAVTLETAGKRGYRILQAEKLAEAARLELAEAEWKVRSRVRASWVDHQFARRALDLLRAEQGIRSENVEILEARLRAGEVSLPDVTVARTDLIATEVTLRSAQGAAAESLASLAAAVGVPVTALEAARFADPARPQALTIEQVQRAGILNRIDLRRSLVEYAASEAALQLEVARQYPDVQLSPGYGFDEGHHKFTFGPSLAIPVLNRNRGPIAEAEARRSEAEARFTELQAQAIGEMEIALARYRAALAELAEAEDRLVPLSGDRERAMRRAVDAGEEDRLALTGLRLQAAVAQRARLEAQRKTQAALGALEDAVQQPLE